MHDASTEELDLLIVGLAAHALPVIEGFRMSGHSVLQVDNWSAVVRTPVRVRHVRAVVFGAGVDIPVALAVQRAAAMQPGASVFVSEDVSATELPSWIRVIRSDAAGALPFR